jgi:hypothetical protein
MSPARVAGHMPPRSHFDLAPTGNPNEWAVTLHLTGYPDGALSARVERGGRGVLGIVDADGNLVDRVVVPGGAKAHTLRSTYRNGVLDAAFEPLRPMPSP